jgi:hypothetical protein
VWHYSWRGNGRRGQGVLGEVVDEILDVLGEGRVVGRGMGIVGGRDWILRDDLGLLVFLHLR